MATWKGTSMKALLTTLLLATTSAHAVSPKSDVTEHIRVQPHGGKVTPAQVATGIRRIYGGVTPKITHVSGNNYDVRFTKGGSLHRVGVNKYAPGLYNMTINLTNGSTTWKRAEYCKTEAIRITRLKHVKSTSCR